MRTVPLALALLTLAVLAAAPAAPAGDKDKPKQDPNEVLIVITGPGGDAKYIKDGDKEQKDVVVTVGQKVTWRNDGNKAHTATSTKQVGGKPLFNTDTLKAKESKTITFDQKLFDDAGGTAGGEVKLEYFCQIHGPAKMKS